jgi:hypothetical protein
MSGVMNRGLRVMLRDYGVGLVTELSREYGFDLDSAMLKMESLSLTHSSKLTSKSKTTKAPKEKAAKEPKKSKLVRLVPSIVFPYCGVRMSGWCAGLRLNHDLFTQCHGALVSGSEYCVTCKKQCETNESGKPTYGTIMDREGCDAMSYEVNGRRVQSYGTVMSKLKLCRENVDAEALRLGVTIPDYQFEVSKAKCGRPRKEKEEKVKGVLGRPRKEKKSVEVSNEGDDMILALLSKANDVSSPVEVPVEAPVVEAPVVELVAVPVVEASKKKGGRKAKAPDGFEGGDLAWNELSVDERKSWTKASKKPTKKAEKVVEPVLEKVIEKVIEKVLTPVVEKVIDNKLEKDADSDSDADSEEEEVERITINGTNYLISTSTSVLYDATSHEPVGRWNVTTKTIEEIELCEEDVDSE